MQILIEYVGADTAGWSEVCRIREEVFVDEQKFDLDLEFDEHDTHAQHLLARIDGKAAGVCRFRATDKGWKLERFAVRKEFRGSGVGSALLLRALADIAPQRLPVHKVYLHAQVQAMPFYEKHGFVAVGEVFLEEDAPHCEMQY